MQPNKFMKTLVPVSLVAAAISMSVSAATSNYSVGFSTVPDITLSEITPLDFGIGIGLASGVTCTMVISDSATATSYVGDVAMNLAGAGDNPAGATVSNLSGTGCTASGTSGTVGIYEISGVAGGTVNVTVNDITGATDFNFAASGCVGVYNGAGDGDVCTAVTGGVLLGNVVLASAADTVGNGGGEGIPAPGVTRLAVGGAITTASVHVAGTLMTESFVIDVTY